MKTKSSLIISATAMLLGSCSNEEVALSNGGSLLKDVTVTIEDADFSALTRASYVVDPSRGFVSSWTQGDVIGIYPLGGDQVAFPISEGEGSATARFDGGSWALRSNVKYSAYYPFSKSNYMVSETAIPVTYVGQKQNGNNSTAGLSSFDYLAAPATQPNATGSVDLTMKHLGAFVRFQLTMPKAEKLVSANVASEGTKFVTEGTVNLSATTPSITATSTSSDFDIALTNVTCAKDEVVTLYAMIAPVNLSTSKLSITLTADDGKTYIYESNGKNFTASKSYNFTITETSGGTGATIPDADWGDGEEHEYVDLGLPSGLKWATCNVGANSPEEYGDYFSWGATKPQEVYDWVHTPYQTQNTTSYSALRFTKYLGSTTSSYKDPSATDADALKTVLDPEDDAAHVNWGGDWRMPTKEEQDELINNCYCKWVTTYNGKSVNGCIVYMAKYPADKGKKTNDVSSYSPVGSYSYSDPHLFLPATGGRYSSDLSSVGVYGVYWSSSLASNNSYEAYHLLIGRGAVYCSYSSSRYPGYAVRPVCQ